MTRPSDAPAPYWIAPIASAPLNATIEVPGSKSLTNRLLVLAALANGPSTLHGALRSRDTDLMIAALKTLGIDIKVGELPSTLHIIPGPLQGGVSIDCGLAGTVMRFLPAVAALADGPVRFDGDPHARVRPMGPVLAALHALGIGVSGEDAEAGGTPSDHDSTTHHLQEAVRGSTTGLSPGAHLPTTLPFTIEGTGAVRGGAVDVDASASSQFVSGLLLAAARFTQGLTVRHVGSTLPSLPHIEMTVQTLRAAGVEVDDSRPAIWVVKPGPIKAQTWRVEPDLSNAAPFWAAALVAGGSVSVAGWPTTTTQPGALVPDLLTQMGGTHHLHDDVMTVTGNGTIHGIDVDLRAAGELAPTIAALAALADSPSRLRGIGHLRGHETDRLAALATEINRLGGQCEKTRDGLVITPRPLRAGRWRTYADHRMATSGALIGLKVAGVEVEDIDTTAKTLPGFADLWASMMSSASGMADGFVGEESAL